MLRRKYDLSWKGDVLVYHIWANLLLAVHTTPLALLTFDFFFLNHRLWNQVLNINIILRRFFQRGLRRDHFFWVTDFGDHVALIVSLELGQLGLLLHPSTLLFLFLLLLNLPQKRLLTLINLLVNILYNIQFLGVFPVQAHAFVDQASVGDWVGDWHLAAGDDLPDILLRLIIDRIGKLTKNLALIRTHMFEVSHFLFSSGRDYLWNWSGEVAHQLVAAYGFG